MAIVPPMHFANGVFRFALELGALAALGAWGLAAAQGGMRYVLMIALPLVAATLWGVFAVRDDPSRNGHPPVPISGVARLGVEFAVFGGAAWALADLGRGSLATTFAVLVGLHCLLAHRRMRWLLKQARHTG